LLRKQRKTLAGYFILPHLVDRDNWAKQLQHAHVSLQV